MKSLLWVALMLPFFVSAEGWTLQNTTQGQPMGFSSTERTKVTDKGVEYYLNGVGVLFVNHFDDFDTCWHQVQSEVAIGMVNGIYLRFKMNCEEEGWLSYSPTNEGTEYILKQLMTQPYVTFSIGDNKFKVSSKGFHRIFSIISTAI